MIGEYIDDGGPAFPCEGGENSVLHTAPGMSLRAWLAGQALSALIAQEDEITHIDQMDGIAMDAVQIADAVISQLKEGGGA